MSVALRLQRGGSKGSPYYRIVATDKRNARDGRFIERIGSYNPMLSKDDAGRVVLKEERVKYWLGVGAQPSDRVHGFLHNAGLLKEKLDISHRPQVERKKKDKKTRQEVKLAAVETAKAEAVANAAAEAEAAKAAAEAPAEEAAPAAE